MTVQTEERTMNFVQASHEALDEALAADESVILLGEDIGDDECGGVFKVTKDLSTRFGRHRVRSTPISEQAIVGAGIGAAIGGLRPVAELMLMNFVAVAMDQICNHAAKLRYMSGGSTPVPLTIRTASGAGAGFGAQHSDQLESWLAHATGLKVVMPSTPADAKGLLLSCIFDDDPCIFIEHTLLYLMPITGPAPEAGARVPLGKARVVRPGTDVTIIGYGKPILDAEAAADSLARSGVEAEIMDLRTIYPWDEQAVLESVARTKRAVIVHEARQSFGVGAELASRIHEELFSDLAAPVLRVGAPHCSVPYAKGLENAYVPGAPEVVAAVRRTLG